MPLRRIAALVALGLSAFACTASCPDPELDNPATATWSTSHAAVTAEGGPVTATNLVLRWTGAAHDRLPPAYYAMARPEVRGDAGGLLVRSTRLTDTHELTIELEDLDGYLKSSTHLELLLELPDQRGVVHCNHPGMGDSFVVPVTLDFDPPTRTVKASLGSMGTHRGACGVGGAPGRSEGAALLSLLVAGAVLGRRRRCSPLPAPGTLGPG